MARAQKSKAKQDDGAGAERPKLTLRVLFSSESRLFGFYDPDTETHCDTFEFETAHEATDAALCHADVVTEADGGNDNFDLVIEGGDWLIETEKNVRIIEDQGYRRYFNGHLYNMSIEELALAIVPDIKAADEHRELLVGKHELPLGQAVDAARRLYVAEFGKRKRKSNAPTLGVFLDNMFFGMDRRTRDRNYSAFLHVASENWPEMDAGYKGTLTGLERIFAAAKEFYAASRPAAAKRKRTPVRQRYNELHAAVMSGDFAQSLDVAQRHNRENDNVPEPDDSNVPKPDDNLPDGDVPEPDVK